MVRKEGIYVQLAMRHIKTFDKKKEKKEDEETAHFA